MRLTRLLAAPAFAGAMLLASTVGSSPANAAISDLACNYDHVHFNACLHFEDVGDPGKLDAHVGLDESMSEAYAQEIISDGVLFRASLWADDGGNGRDQFLADLTVAPGWPAAWAGGLSVELIANGVPRSILNEDPHDRDEIYAIVSYSHRGDTVVRRTGTVRGEFADVGPAPGNPGCQVLC